MQAAIQAFPEPETKLAHTAAEPGKPTDTRALRDCLGQMATGVTVVSTRTQDGAFIGLTCNSFAALSLDPPLVTWSLRLTSPSLEAFQHAPRFVVNVLAEAQVEVSRRFASSVANRFEGVAHAENAHGVPLLHGASAWFECRTISSQTAGDHCMFIAEVEHFSSSEAAPLLFHGGGYFALGSRL